MSEPSEDLDGAMPPDVRFVKRLVVVLTSVMIVGLVVIVGLLVARIMQAPAQSVLPLALPDSVALPDGIVPDAVTLAQDWVLVLAGNEVLLFDRATGTLAHRIALP